MLYNRDFINGTYRIQESGYYKIMEDIVFDMNRDDINFPNKRGNWFPRASQSDIYSGSDGSFVGSYSMGFFTGISVETNNVTIDLNGKTLKMDKAFHLQQRWFSIIELASSAFIPGQGPGNFGAFLYSASNVTIFNGTLGLSSHHGIHGNNAADIILKDLIIKDFEVAGISMNGFNGLSIENVEVGPVYTEVPVLGVYTQARLMLGRLKSIIDMYGKDYGNIQIHNRDTNLTAWDITNNLETQMDVIFKHFIKGISWNELSTGNEAKVNAARKLFENVVQVPTQSTVYGIFLNSEGASVFGIGGAPGNSYGLKMKNVNVHGLYNDAWEVPRILLTKGPFNDIMDVTRNSDNGLSDKETATYIGSSYTDAQFGIHKLTDEWSVLGHSALDDAVNDWIESDIKLDNEFIMSCNNDIMLHVTKGVFGLRVDNIDGIDIDNVNVYDIQNVGSLGSYVCGNYEGIGGDGGHRNQNWPLLRGYTGTEAHGVTFTGSTGNIRDINVNNIVSARGDAFGIQFYPSNNIIIDGNINITDIHAGAFLKYNKLPKENMPNKVPRGCGIDKFTYFDTDQGYYKNEILFQDIKNINTKCVTFHTECDTSEYDVEWSINVDKCDDSTIVKENDIKRGTAYYAIKELSSLHMRLFDYLEYQDSQKMEDKDGFSIHENKAKSRKSTSESGHTISKVILIIAVILTGCIILLLFFIMLRVCWKHKRENELNNETTPLIAKVQEVL